MIRYYSGDEQPLRDDESVWATALSFSVNCSQKRLTVKFWEKIIQLCILNGNKFFI